jgi:transposase
MKKIDDYKHQQIIDMRKRNYPWKVISDITKVNISTCRSIFCRFISIEGLPPKVVIKKSCITSHMGIFIKRLIEKEPNLSIRKITTRLNSGFNTKISIQPICDFLKKNNIKKVSISNKMIISNKNIELRISFAKQMKIKDLDFFRKIIWSDEFTVQGYNSNGQTMVWKTEGKKIINNLKIARFQKGKISASFWGCFSFYGKGPLVIIDGILNSEKYIAMLKEFLLPEIDQLNIQIHFMQDNARPHSSKITKKFFNDNGIILLPWPPQSPDINPIENIWGIIKQKLYADFPVPKSKNDLINNVLSIWDDLPTDLFQILAENVPDRIDQLIKKKGNLIK